jgi:hypothetical protein
LSLKVIPCTETGQPYFPDESLAERTKIVAERMQLLTQLE